MRSFRWLVLVLLGLAAAATVCFAEKAQQNQIHYYSEVKDEQANVLVVVDRTKTVKPIIRPIDDIIPNPEPEPEPEPTPDAALWQRFKNYVASLRLPALNITSAYVIRLAFKLAMPLAFLYSGYYLIKRALSK